MACNVPRQVGATYKVLWRSVKQNAALRAAGKTKKRYKGLDTPPKYVSPKNQVFRHGVTDYVILKLHERCTPSLHRKRGAHCLKQNNGLTAHVCWQEVTCGKHFYPSTHYR